MDKITDMEIISTVDDIVVELANLTLPEQAQMHLTSEFVVVVDVLSLLNKYVGICTYSFTLIIITIIIFLTNSYSTLLYVCLNFTKSLV